MTKPNETDEARFESLLAQVLDGGEKALAHRVAKDSRNEARQDAVDARASFTRNRERPAKPGRRRPKRQG